MPVQATFDDWDACVDDGGCDGREPYNGSAEGEYRQQTLPVGSFPPNPFGLYDLAGNVWQWVEDRYHNSYQGAPGDGSPWTTGASDSARIVRGVSWYTYPGWVRSANRFFNTPDGRDVDFGFRVARTLNQ